MEDEYHPILANPSSRGTSPEAGELQLYPWRFSIRKEDVSRNLKQVAVLFRSPASRFCLATFFVKHIAFMSEGFMFQYASERFHWALYQTAWLRVANALGAIFATMIAWPVITSILVDKDVVAHKIDVNAVRISLAIVSFSFFGAWTADSGSLLVIGEAQKNLKSMPGLSLIKCNSDVWRWARGRFRASARRPFDLSYRFNQKCAAFYDCSDG